MRDKYTSKAFLLASIHKLSLEILCFRRCDPVLVANSQGLAGLLVSLSYMTLAIWHFNNIIPEKVITSLRIYPTVRHIWKLYSHAGLRY